MRTPMQPSNVAKQLVLLFAAFLALVPTIYMVITALKSDEEYAIDKLGFPHSPVLENFRSVLVDSPFLYWMLNSGILVAGAVMLSTAISVPTLALSMPTMYAGAQYPVLQGFGSVDSCLRIRRPTTPHTI